MKFVSTLVTVLSIGFGAQAAKIKCELSYDSGKRNVPIQSVAEETASFDLNQDSPILNLRLPGLASAQVSKSAGHPMVANVELLGPGTLRGRNMTGMSDGTTLYLLTEIQTKGYALNCSLNQ